MNNTTTSFTENSSILIKQIASKAVKPCLELVKHSCISIKGCSTSSCKKANWTCKGWQMQLYQVNSLSSELYFSSCIVEIYKFNCNFHPYVLKKLQPQKITFLIQVWHFLYFDMEDKIRDLIFKSFHLT